MISLGGRVIDLSDPLTQGAAVASAVALLLVLLLWVTLHRAGRTAALLTPLAQQLGQVAQRVQGLNDGQQQLAGGLTHVAEAQAAAQAGLLQLMEARLAEVTLRVEQNLSGSASRTAQSLGDLQQRLKTIDRAQANIEKLSGDVLSLQDILSNKQTRGAFGEIQLHDIITKALPKDSFTWQATLSNGRRADCLIHLPQPPGPIVIDSKFPLDAYEALRRAESDHEKRSAVAAMRTAVRAHVRAIAEKYVLPGETAEGAMMFLPSEAVYAELHGNFPELVREGFAAKVWIVSPTTCMATLTTMRAILKDARMQAQAGEIRRMLKLLHRDMELVVERVGKLDTHFSQARADLDGIGTVAERAGKRAARLDNFDFEEVTPGIGEPAPSNGASAPLVLRRD